MESTKDPTGRLPAKKFRSNRPISTFFLHFAYGSVEVKRFKRFFNQKNAEKNADGKKNPNELATKQMLQYRMPCMNGSKSVLSKTSLKIQTSATPQTSQMFFRLANLIQTYGTSFLRTVLRSYSKAREARVDVKLGPAVLARAGLVSVPLKVNPKLVEGRGHSFFGVRSFLRTVRSFLHTVHSFLRTILPSNSSSQTSADVSDVADVADVIFRSRHVFLTTL